ncbi:uncharacterized protein PFL1_00708 [Pseudozyma flocculosa PF-1]|uniref:Uncharacterized protein n=1 Tax=Pseudozyma flocculosa TaxID=84751 RepID=A0A5C3F5A3_9BASI|nr:uncharacterized protein PFL1_00708 [Pseudozyma flocculosa PF-1]EPQ31373.1 hypothetical protein PFL1_00708 [Pseudozyma flocculosa PF-1]SPO38847.1 uncharacterized protein PSFLO_04326 [Pseudozyma flocculosa]
MIEHFASEVPALYEEVKAVCWQDPTCRLSQLPIELLKRIFDTYEHMLRREENNMRDGFFYGVCSCCIPEDDERGYIDVVIKRNAETGLKYPKAKRVKWSTLE